ncbi:MAG: penicillin-binding protein 2 [Rhodocyclaceae bacterium]|nr:penicillin-binding protein 2 [Rhodocyclaceae bacterium]
MRRNSKSVTFNRNPLLARDLPIWRPRVVLLALLAGSFALVGRAAYLQGVNDDFLQAKGESRFSRVLTMPANRGRILDRSGDVLAISTPVKSVAWSPPLPEREGAEVVRPQPAQLRKLAGLLQMDVHELTRKLDGATDFTYLKRQLSPDDASRVAALAIPGIHLEQEFRRYYPGGEATAHLLGFTGDGDSGQEGVELAFDDRLAGVDGSRRVIKDRRGRIVEDVESIRLPQEGTDLQLSIDGRIQHLAYTALKEAVAQHKARAGGVVVLDARSGEVLALVNSPSFNPNDRRELFGARLRNRALTDTYEPGSTMKPFTAAMALDLGTYRFDTVVDTGEGRMTIGNRTIRDTKKHGLLTVAEVIQKSSNVGAATIALSFDPKVMWGYFDRLGFGAPLDLGFPGEAGGRLRPPASWKPIEQATMSYGHGLSVTLMQMAHAYLALAREGDLIPVSLLRSPGAPAHGRQVFSPQTAQAIRSMLELVVQEGGTAPMAQVAGYRVGGKTGTAHKIEDGRYADKYVASFVGVAPMSDPRLVVAVMIDEPGNGKHYGGTVAGPVFAQIVAGALRSLGVPPDAPLTPVRVAQQASPAERM